jgi:hypothetical protein
MVIFDLIKNYSFSVFSSLYFFKNRVKDKKLMLIFGQASIVMHSEVGKQKDPLYQNRTVRCYDNDTVEESN